MPFPSRRINIALWISTSTEKGRGLVRGVAQFAHEQPSVRVHRFPKSAPLTAEALTALGAHGIVATLQSRRDLRRLLEIGLPFINLTGEMHAPGISTVRTDDEAVGRLAAQYFANRGHRRLAYCGARNHEASADRKRGMREFALQHGLTFASLDMDVARLAREPRAQIERVERWLRELPRPVGMLVHSDDVCVHLVEACTDLGLDVPGDIAVLGVSVDSVRLAFAAMEISSIELNTREIGAAAGRMIFELISHRDRKRGWPREQLIRPLKIVTRRSTDRRAVDDDLVVRALDFIRDNPSAAIGVSDVLRAVGSSRRRLELRFRAKLGRSIHNEIQRHRFERAAELMCEPGRTFAEIADAAGFRNGRHLSIAFRRHLETTPGELRRRLLTGQAGVHEVEPVFRRAGKR